jgi:2'-5' RNA ligase
MKLFAGIVPPPEIYNRILSIQKQFGDNRLEPHITLRPPIEVTDEQQWVNTIVNAALNFNSFNIQLTGTGHFGSRVLFISVESVRLLDLYERLMPELNSFERAERSQRDEKYHPHLTLGRGWCGFTKDDFAGMRKLADEYLINQNVSFEVKAIRIYNKPETQKGWQLFKDAPLLSVK